MFQATRFLAAVALCAASLAAQQQRSEPPLATNQPPPAWAYVGNAPQHVPNSKESYTYTQIQDLFAVPDWHPDSHPKMPDVVAFGRKPDVYACGYCHLPNGLGRPENASLAGLPKDYIVQQMAAFQSGARKSSEPKSLPVNAMILVASHATPQEAAAGAEYFSKLTPKPWIRVVEASNVAKTHVAGWMLVPDEPSIQEPIGSRIVEVPGNTELTELRDDTSGFVAYVPPGSLKKGKFLVEKGGDGITLPCSQCHGPDLRGKDNVPSIAGRSPSYIMRQLYDLQIGSRGGGATDQMQIPVMKLSMGDMVAIAAYLASLKP